MFSPWNLLEPEEKGFVLGAVLLGGGREAAVALSEPAQTRCAATLGWLEALDRAERGAAVAAAARELAVPFPPGLEALHPSWLEAALADEPDLLLRWFAHGPSPALREAALARLRARGAESTAGREVVEPALLAELGRAVLAPLSPRLVAGGPQAQALVRLSPEALRAELARQGARTMGLSIGGAPEELRARAAAQLAPLGEPLVQELLRASAEAVPSDVRERARADLLAAAGGNGDPQRRLLIVGIRSTGRALAGEGDASLRALEGRLPVDLAHFLWET